MKKDKKGLLLALCLGDGHLRISKNGNGAPNKTTGQLALLHSTAQREYMEWKVDRLHKAVGGKRPNVIVRKTFNKTNGKTYERCEATKCHKYFRVLHKWLYPKGVKVISRKLMDYLTPEGIAIWVMDDGGIKKYTSVKTGKVSCCQFYLATYVDYDNAVEIQKYFSEVWGIEFKLSQDKSGKWRHYCNTTETKKLCDLIRPYVIPSMEYKLLPTSAEPVLIRDDIV